MASHGLIDTYGRKIDYLRLSVTDRCNFNCVYCMPPEGLPSLEKSEILTFEEIVRVARIFLTMGGSKLRITGGEPLVRRNVVDLVGQLSKLPHLKDLALTTNGFYLNDLAKPLKKAGLKRINISLDSLSASRFAQLTQVSAFDRVWAGMEAALTLNLNVKLNVVVMKGIAREEIVAFGELASRLPVEVRFIEFMPLCGSGWHPEWMVPLEEVRDILKESFSLIPIKDRGTEVAESYKIEWGKGSVGFIASVTEPFCNQCSRIRLTADGKLRPCLFSKIEFDLKQKLRGGWPDADLMAVFRMAVHGKPKGHELSQNPMHPEMKFLELPSIRFLGG